MSAGKSSLLNCLQLLDCCSDLIFILLTCTESVLKDGCVAIDELFEHFSCFVSHSRHHFAIDGLGLIG